MSTLLVADDHPVICSGIESVAKKHSPITQVYHAADAQEASRLISPEIDVFLTDVHFESPPDGVALIEHLREEGYDIPILVFSMIENQILAERALDAGANGYLAKRDINQTIAEALRTVMMGGVYVSDLTGEPEHDLGQLSDREIDLMRMVGYGRTTQTIADSLDLKPSTVRNYRSRVAKKLGIETSSLNYVAQEAFHPKPSR